MKKSWRFLRLGIIVIVILTTMVGASIANAQTICSPATSISVPFTKDSVGTFCWYTTSLCYQVNSWNTTALSINGTSYKNMFVLASSIPPLNGGYTITFDGGTIPYAPGHIEITGPYQGSGTGPCESTPATSTPAAPTTTLTRTNTPSGPTATRSRTPTTGPTATRTRTNTPTIVLTPTRTITPAGDLGFGSVSGTVTDAITGVPIADALITCTHGSLFTPVEEHCVGTTTTGTNGTYLFSNIHVYASDTITVRVDATGYNSQWYVSQTQFTSANVIVNFALSLVAPTATVTRTPTPGPSLTPTKTLTPTITLSPTPTLPGGICSPVEATLDGMLPFTADGLGTHCWRVSSFTFFNSNNTGLISVNGVNLTNQFATPTSLSMPAQINGYWYITYVGAFPWSHFEIH